MENSTQSSVDIENDKSVAIVSYLTIIGWIIAFAMHSQNKTYLGTFHLRQTIALFVIGICLWMVQMLLTLILPFAWMLSILLFFVYIGLFVLWLIGFIAAINGQKRSIPIIGERAQQWFVAIK